MFYKACPRCHGDVFSEDLQKRVIELVCLQCGWRRDPKRQIVEFGRIEGTHRLKTLEKLVVLAS